ncbi:MAG: glycoside hydrolase family 127 protein [Candidatus Hydrogenedentes bacterium]|nr:glycoside hydrolase family 127 protein [Candidatus Hydrogenedentota bacterium]
MKASHARVGLTLGVLTMVLFAPMTADPQEAIEPVLRAFPLSQVRLLDGRFKDEQERDRAYLHALEPDRLLHCFWVNAGLPAPGAPYGGWEAAESEVRGHFVGHYLSACALMYASTGDEELKARADAMVSEFAKCQEALGGEYVSAYPASFIDRVEAGQPVWAPYYVIHKIMAGLYDVHVLCGNAQALDVLERMASYFGKRIDALPIHVWDRALRNEFGGMSEVLHNLYAITRKPEHLKLAHAFDQAEILGPLALEHDNLAYLHGNTQIPKVIGAARHYEVTGDTRYRDLSIYFWDRVVDTRTYATGGSTMYEHWPEPGKLAATLGHLNHETCKTHNMLKLTRHLLEWMGDTRYGDFYERALFNGILGTQGPEPGQLQYYVPMDSGYPRMFGSPDNAFWCCYGTGIESFAKLGDSIYFHDDESLFVNLFVASTVEWTEKGLRVEQQTTFPYENKTALTVHASVPVETALNIRVPSWIAASPVVRVNGQPQAIKPQEVKPWLRITRRWEEGDRVEVALPMKLHTESLPDDPRKVAILYGPVVLAGVYDGHAADAVCIDNHHEGVAALKQSVQPVYFVGNPDSPETWLEPGAVDRPLFRGKDANADMQFIPFCDVTVERYGLYWPVVETNSPQHQGLQLAGDRYLREVDRVFIFTREFEHGSERLHDQQGEKTAAGAVPGTAYVYRHAEPGGWFSWQMAAPKDSPAELLVTYWGGDMGRTFDITVDDEIIATPTLKPERPDSLVDHVYPIPQELTNGKEHITIAFRANHETIVGGVFGCAVLRQD